MTLIILGEAEDEFAQSVADYESKETLELTIDTNKIVKFACDAVADVIFES